MVWYFIGVYIINRTLHGRLEIQNFSARVENISLVRYAHSWNIFQHSKKNSVSPRGHVISSMYDKIDIRNTIRETWKQVFGNLAWAVMLLILFPSILQKISKMRYGNFVEFDLGHSSEGERVNYQLTVFLYEWLFIAASSIGSTSAIGTSSGSWSNIHN